MNDAAGEDLTLDAVRAGGKPALAQALAALERDPDGAAVRALLNAAYAAPRAHVVGVTGPPGVGKSTLLGALIGRIRAGGRSVGVIAVDPSSRRSGGALLGDRVRLRTDAEDAGVFVRSMAARDRLGGLAGLSYPAMVLMRALFDVVLIETVGVGQSESDVLGVADTVLLCIQPGAGDSLQFMKAGIVELPQLLAVTKADMAAEAAKARAEAEAALAMSPVDGDAWRVPVLAVSAQDGIGIDDLLAALDRHRDWLAAGDRLAAARRAQAAAWLTDSVRERWGRDGLRRAGALGLAPDATPFDALAEVAARQP